ncbi:MAG: pyridoxamine 5'-phosphate oxidase family protein [Chloroflexota bacterium]
MNTQDLIPSVERTLMLLEIIRHQQDGIAVQSILTNLDISRSSLFALLNSLKQLGYVEQRDKRGYYYPGPRLQAWSQSSPSKQQDQIVNFYHEANRINCNETLALAIRVPNGCVIIAQIESPQQVRSVYQIGQTYEKATGSAAWQILHAPSAETKQYGYAKIRDSNCVEVAFPICADGIHADSALLFNAPTFRCPDSHIRDILPLLREMAARCSYRLGALTYTPYRVIPEIVSTSPMVSEQIDGFLQGPWTARLACVREDQSPHVVPVWQEWDGEHFYVVAWRGSQWAKYVQAHPQVSLTVDEPWPPFRRVTARGRAHSLSEHEADYEQMLHQLYHRFLGSQVNLQTQSSVELAFRIEIDSIVGWQGIPGQ